MSDPSSGTRVWSSPTFLIACVLLAGAAVGLRPGIAALQQRFTKEGILPLRPLDDLDFSAVTGWVQAHDAPGYDGDDEVLETTYWTTPVFHPAEAADPDDVHTHVRTLITYYCTPGNQVPHTPEVCFRQGGAAIESMETITFDLPGLGAAEDRIIEAKAIHFVQYGWNEACVYTFCCNGEFFASRERVRMAIGMPGDRYVYFSKIEALADIPPGTDPRDAVDQCVELLQALLPVLARDHFPDRETVRGP